MSVARDGPIPLCGCAFLSVQNSCCAMLVCWALLLFGCFFGRRYLPIPLTLLTVASQLKTLLTYVLAVLLSSKLLAVVSIVARASFSVAVSSPAVLGFG